MVTIQQEIVKQGKRNSVPPSFHAKNDKETIAAWRRDLDRILHIFNVRPISPIRPFLIASYSGGAVNR